MLATGSPDKLRDAPQQEALASFMSLRSEPPTRIVQLESLLLPVRRARPLRFYPINSEAGRWDKEHFTFSKKRNRAARSYTEAKSLVIFFLEIKQLCCFADHIL